MVKTPCVHERLRNRMELPPDPQVFDTETLSKLGVSNAKSQHILAVMLNSWFPILAEDRIYSLQELNGAMKRKITQTEHLLLENQQLQRGPSADLNEVSALKKIISEKDAEIQQLKAKKQKVSKDSDQKGLGEAIQAKSNECATLQREIAKLQKDAENKNAEFQGRLSTVNSNARKLIDEKELHRAMAVTISEEAISCVRAYRSIYDETSAIMEGMQSTLQKQEVLQERLLRSMSSFYVAASNTYMVCPIPTRSGYLMPIREIIDEWLNRPGDFQGEVHATFRCKVSGGDNSIASAEYLTLIRKIAKDMGITLKAPVSIYIRQGNDPYHDVLFFEQLRVISTMCKMYRAREKEPEERILLYQGQRYFHAKMIKNKVSEPVSYHMACEYGFNIPTATPPKVHHLKIVVEPGVFPGLTFVTK